MGFKCINGEESSSPHFIAISCFQRVCFPVQGWNKWGSTLLTEILTDNFTV